MCKKKQQRTKIKKHQNKKYQIFKIKNTKSNNRHFVDFYDKF